MDIIRRIANTEEGRSKIGLPNEEVQISNEGDNKYALVYVSGYVVIDESLFETEIIREILSDILPEDYKIEISQKNTDDIGYCVKCSIHNIRNFHTMSFSYGANHLEATGKCLLQVLKLLENKEIFYEEYGNNDFKKVST